MRIKICRNVTCFKEYTGPGFGGKFYSQECAMEQQRRAEAAWKENGHEMQESGKTPVPSFVPKKL
jgi:hypothetical protein